MKGSYTCIFGGGAVRGLAYVGAIKALKELQFNVKTFAGSSVGSIVAGLLAVGYDADEIKDLFMQVNFELFRDIQFGINKEFAISKGNVFTDWIREAIEAKFYGENYKKGNNPPVKFGDLSKNLVIITTDLNDFKCVEFSNFETPDFEIATAIRISCSMPGLMPPVEYEDNRLVDGDLLKGIPLWRLSKNINSPDCRVLEFRLEGENIQKDSNPLDFINSIYSCMTSASTDFIIDVFGGNDKFDYIKITTGDTVVINFNIQNDAREQLINVGYKDSIKYLTTDCIAKKIRISKYYEDMIQHIDKLIRALKYNNINESVDILKDLFMYISDVYKFIDTDIFESLWTLKNDILSAPQKYSWLRGKKFKDRTPYIETAEIMRKVIAIKRDELLDFIESVQ